MWCARCKHRLIVQRAVGRAGGVYYYFNCRGRQQGLCDLPSVPVEVLEKAVAAHYATITMPANWSAEVRAELDQSVSDHHELSDTLRDQYTRQLAELERKEDYFVDLPAEQGRPKDNSEPRSTPSVQPARKSKTPSTSQHINSTKAAKSSTPP